jgi:nucleotide-binding universal stress UspA family protein
MRILIAIDGKPESLAAVRAVLREGPAGVDRVDLVNVQPLLHRYVSRWIARSQREGWREERSAAALAPARSMLQTAGFNPGTHAIAGHLAPSIAKLAQDLRSDQIVIGSSRRGPFGRAFANSVSTRLLEASSVPVRVVPTAEASLLQRLALPAGLGLVALLLLADE